MRDDGEPRLSSSRSAITMFPIPLDDPQRKSEPDMVDKTLVLTREEGTWKILEERISPP